MLLLWSFLLFRLQCIYFKCNKVIEKIGFFSVEKRMFLGRMFVGVLDMLRMEEITKSLIGIGFFLIFLRFLRSFEGSNKEIVLRLMNLWLILEDRLGGKRFMC